jgi:hypothetical protein
MSAPEVRIVDCAEVLPGFSMQRRVEHDINGTHHVILARHLREGQPYVFAASDEVRIVPPRDVHRYLLRPGDVLFMSRGSRNTAATVAAVPKRTIVPLSFYVLRPTNRVDPAYLAWCINQPPVQAAIASIRTGAGTPIVPRKEFGEIRIPLPSLDVQRRIARLGELMAQERQLARRLSEEVERAQRLIGDRLVKSLLTNNQAGRPRSKQ